MPNLQDEYPTLAADAVTNPESARLLALLAKADKALTEQNKLPPRFELQTTPTE